MKQGNKVWQILKIFLNFKSLFSLVQYLQ
jgi:hypothetical protein